MFEIEEIKNEEGFQSSWKDIKKEVVRYDSAGMSSLSSYVQGIFESFKTARLPFEEIWEECWYNFLGQYQASKVWKRKTEGKKYRSRIFIKLTTLKCHTAHSKIADVLFTGRNVMPFDVEALDPEAFGIPHELAKEASQKMKDKIKSHFKKIWLKKKMDLAILEMAIFGTAILKGPIITTKRVPRVNIKSISGIPVNEIDSEINPYEIDYADEIVPDVDRVGIWEYYVDVNARSPQDSIGEIQFKRMLPAEFRLLANQGGYDSEAVREAARRAGTADPNDKTYIQLGDNYMGEQGDKDKRVSVLEYWGLVPVSMLREAGVQVPEDADDEDSIEGLIVLAGNGIVIKACVNPLGRRPFYVCPFKERPGQIYGTGVAEAMRDSQKMINSAARLLIDNKAMSGNGMVAINLDRINTKRTKDLDIYPQKTWYIKGNFNPKEAIDAVSFPDVTMGLRELIEMFERFADEETGIPKYSGGVQSDFMNKMLDVNTPIPMADGTYKKLRDVVDGDRIIGRDGKPTTVIKAHPIQYPKRAYEIEFRSGDVIVAGGEHLWTFASYEQARRRRWTIVDTDTLYEKFKTYEKPLYIPRIVRPDFDNNEDLPLNPYILGLWLGNGTHNEAELSINAQDKEVIKYLSDWIDEKGGKLTITPVKHTDKAVRCYLAGIDKGKEWSVKGLLRELGIFGNKHIPEKYLKASYKVRLSLLRGLMDTDGNHNRSCVGYFSQKEGRLLDDVIKLIISLGAFPTVKEVKQPPFGKQNIKYYSICFSLIDNPFGYSEKAKKWKLPIKNKNIFLKQKIVSMKEVDIKLMRCLTVDAKDGLYCVGNRFTVTHNTATGVSMLMTQANINLKTVIENLDDYLIEPLVEAFGEWFQQFGEDKLLLIPLRYKATGADSMIAKEIKMENYMKFMQITSAPQDAIFMDRVKMMKAIARLLETEDVMRADEEIEKIMQEMSRQAVAQKDVREMVDLDRLYPLMSRYEQIQVLKQLGIEPDMNTNSVPALSGSGASSSPLTGASGQAISAPRQAQGDKGAGQ